MQAALPFQARGHLRRFFLPGVLLVVFILAPTTVISRQAQAPIPFHESPQVGSVVEANNAFAIDLYQKLKDQPGDLFFSPYSISASLAMTYAGARRQTAVQMAKVLHFNSTQTDVHAAFGQLTKRINDLQGHDRVALLSANSLWCQRDYPFTPIFLKLVQTDYDAEAQAVDFIHDAESAQNDINSWVAQKTDGKIEGLMGPTPLSQDTRLVLCNAIYFKGTWQTKFNLADTKPAPFYIATNQTVTVPMMSQHGNFAIAYDENNSVELLEMPYTGNDLSMIILLPANEPGFEYRWNKKPQPALPTLEEKLTARNLYSWLHEVYASQEEADISIPRFTTTQSFDLSKLLKSLGMTSAFDSTADFSGMDGTGNLGISDVLHKAYVQVNEEGTEAAAATATFMTAGIPESFIVDRPFIFLIRDNATGEILFLGRIVDPTK